MRLPVVPKICLLLVGLLSLPSFSNEGSRLSRHQIARIDSCLVELTRAGRTADSATRVRIESNVRAIRAQLAPVPKRSVIQGGMDSVRFNKLRGQVESSFPYREQRKLLRLAAIDSRFTVAQVEQLLRLVSFGSDMADAANLLLPRIVDLENVYDLRDVMWTTQASKALDDFLDSLATSP
jgi:hypothetical protein